MPRTKACARKRPLPKKKKTVPLKSNEMKKANSMIGRPKRKPSILTEKVTNLDDSLSDAEMEMIVANTLRKTPVPNSKSNKNGLKRKCNSQKEFSASFNDSLKEITSANVTLGPLLVSDSDEDISILPDRLGYEKELSQNISNATTSNDKQINSDDVLVIESSEIKPPVIYDDLGDYSSEDLYECDFNSLKESACKELKKTELLRVPITIASDNTDKDSSSDSDIELPPVSTKVTRAARTSNKSKLIQAALKVARDQLRQQNSNTSLDGSLAEDVMIVEKFIENVSVRVCWGTTSKRYDVSAEEPFANLYAKLAEEHKVNQSEIVLSLNGRVILPSNCVKTIGYTIVDVIEGGVIQKSQNCSPMDMECISLKVQCANLRDSVMIKVGKFDKMEVLMKKYATLKELEVSTFTFHFDGEKLSPNETPFSLDMEGDECIDAYQISNKI